MKWDGPKPPGIPAHSMQMDLINDLSGDVLESIPVGVMMLAPDEEYKPLERPLPEYEWCKDYPLWKKVGGLAQHHLEDCLAVVAESLLMDQQPYPGDYDESNCQLYE